MGLRQFFFSPGFFPLRTVREVCREIFDLCYYSEGGFSFDLWDTTPQMRRLWGEMLNEAKKDEAAKVKAASQKKKR